MACEKYSSWMTDAALGKLVPGREPEFLAHVAECDACRAACQYAREVAAFVDRGVESLVSAEPSTGFNARLRARIAAEHVPARFNWLAWTPIAAGALALVVLLAVLLSRAPHLTDSPSVASNSQPPSALSHPSNPLPPGVSVQDHPLVAPVASRVHSIAKRAKPQPQPEVPEIIVPPGQLAAIVQFADAVRAGHIDGEKLLAAQQQGAEPLEIEPLEIVPLAPPQPDVAPDGTEDSGRP